MLAQSLVTTATELSQPTLIASNRKNAGLSSLRAVISHRNATISYTFLLLIVKAWQEIYLFSKNVQTASGAHPACYSIGTGVVSPGLKRPWRDVNHSPASSAEVKKD